LLDGTCYATDNCPEGYYEQDVDGVDTCEVCPEGCSSCDNASTCTGCVSLNWKLEGGVCTQACSAWTLNIYENWLMLKIFADFEVFS